MKDYIKPTFILANLSPMAMTSNSCSMTDSEFREIVGDAGLEWTFSPLEGCVNDEASGELDMFCKFTAGEIDGMMSIIGS